MKRNTIFAMVLIAAIMCGAIFDAAASGAPGFAVETVQARAGEQIELSICIKNSPGITSARVLVTFGEELTLTDVSEGDIGEGSFMGPGALRSPVYINWVYGTGNISGDYLLAKLTFSIAENAAPGLYPVTLSYDPDDVYSVDLKTYAETNVPFTVTNGGIRVEAAADGCSHSYTEYTSNRDAACAADGTKTASCTLCGQRDTVADAGSALGHEFTEKIEDDAHRVPGSGADCRRVKEYYYDCARCDTVGTEVFAGSSMGNHVMGTQWKSENGIHYLACTVNGCGYTEAAEKCSGAGERCEVCGSSLVGNTTHPAAPTESTAEKPEGAEGVVQPQAPEGDSGRIPEVRLLILAVCLLLIAIVLIAVLVIADAGRKRNRG